MSRTRYDESNHGKASFDKAYIAPTPHRYLASMAAIGYRLAERMHPFLSAVVHASSSAEAPLRVLDVGCSYGISSALLKTGCSYGALSAFYCDDASRDYDVCVRETQEWLQEYGVREDVTVVGLDSSNAAVRFATDARLIDRGIACDLEVTGARLAEAERSVIATCDVLFSAGTIGYVSDRTMDPLLNTLGSEGQGAMGPVAIMSVLELFSPEPIAKTFDEHGYRFGVLPVRVPQRQFADKAEQERVIDTLQRRGVSTDVQETENLMFANLCVAALPHHFNALVACVTETARGLPQAAVRCGEGAATHGTA